MVNQVVTGAAQKNARYGGGLLSAPLDAPAPTDATTDLDAAFVAISLVGDSGLSDSISRSNDDVRDINGDIVLTVQTEHGLTASFTLLERTVEALKEVNGQGNVTETVDASGNTLRVIKYNAEELPRRSYVLQLKSRGRTIRKYYPIAQITEISEVQYAKSAPISYECTLTAYQDEDGQVQYEYEHIPAEAL